MPRTLVGAVGAGLLAAFAVLAMRASVESSSRDVEIALDGPDWEALARREGQDPLTLFARAREHGATAVAVYEQTLKRLAEQGEVAYATGGQVLSRARMGSLPGAFRDLVAAGAARPGRLYIAASPELLGFVGTGFGEVLGTAQVRRIGGLLEVPGLLEELEEAPLGYMPRDLAPYTRLGLHPLLRLRNYPGMAASGLRAKMARLAQLGRGYPVVFDKTEVLGYAGLIPQTAAALQSAGFPYGRIEVFSVRRKQRGEDQLAALMRPHVIRLFSLTADELLALTPESVRDKFVLAARERNIRILYLRPILPTAGNVGTDANLVLLDQITGDLTRFGLRPGPARAFPDIRIPRVLMLGVILGALAAIALALMPLGRAVGIAVPEKVAWALVGIGIVVSLLTMTGGLWVLWRKILALGTASAVPVLAVAVAFPRAGVRPGLASVGALWVASLISLVGGVLVAALLSGWEFMMAADVFLGVKLAHLLPVILVAVVLATADHPPRHWREGVAQLWAWSSRPLLFRYAALAVVVGLGAVILVARSGNFGLPVLPIEERLRTLTGDLLVARPRTKEYLIGHPALVLAAAAAAAGWRLAVAPLAAVGAIGQAGIINSFSHIHTPLLYTAWRTANALVLGSLLGAAALGVVRLGWILASRPDRSARRRRQR